MLTQRTFRTQGSRSKKSNNLELKITFLRQLGLEISEQLRATFHLLVLESQDQTQDFVHTRQVLYQLSHVPRTLKMIFYDFFLLLCICIKHCMGTQRSQQRVYMHCLCIFFFMLAPKQHKITIYRAFALHVAL